jgi:hypothetical protein
MKHNLNIIVWVNDIIILRQRAAINKMKAKLKQRFNVKNLEQISHFLGMRITRNRHRHTICIGQRAYLEQVIQRFDMSDTKSVGTPTVRLYIL